MFFFLHINVSVGINPPLLSGDDMMPLAKQEEYQMGQKDGQVTAYKVFLH